MHTIKGNARTFEFTQITDAAHRAEQTYDQLRKDDSAAWNPQAMLAELAAVEAAVNRYVAINENKLGRKGRASDLLTTRGSFVANEQLAQLRSMAAALVATQPGSDLRQLRQAIDGLGLVPVERLVSGAVDSLASLATELEKPAPALDMTSGDLAVNGQFAEALKSSLMHILRNSLDHGIEAPTERRLTNKPVRGTVRVNCIRHGEKLELHVSDDGRGLALHKLYETGLAAGISNAAERPSAQQVAEIIFRSGLSTAARVTQVSGRGVGMEAVRTFLEEQGAKIHIDLEEPGQELHFTPFTFVIEVPPTALSHAA
jgi:two-component system chemotaxis sensor kinase CheA